MNLRAPVQKILAWRLFSRPEQVASFFEIIKQWELRRIPYNAIVGATGILTLAVLVIVASIATEKFGEPLGLPDPPIIAVFAVFAYGAGANICYTVGWIAEVAVQEIWREKGGVFGQISFFLGLLFSILLTLTPAALFTALLIVELLLR
jgi:hypothetical protein